MSEDIKLPMMGTDGKLRWIAKEQMTEFLEKGWFVYKGVPRETYYPQYDQRLSHRAKPPVDDGAGVVVTQENLKDKLGIIVC